MALWAIACDLDVKAMKDAGLLRSEVTDFYNTVRGCFATYNFEKFHQLNLYTNDSPNAICDSFLVCQALTGIKDSEKFLKQLDLLRFEHLNDLLPLVAPGRVSSSRDPIWDEIERVFHDEHAHAGSVR